MLGSSCARGAAWPEPTRHRQFGVQSVLGWTAVLMPDVNSGIWKLLAKVARYGKVRPLITKRGLKSHSHDLSIGLKSRTIGTAVQIAK